MTWINPDPSTLLSPGIYWITRDSNPEGVLEDVLDVWEDRPMRVDYEGNPGHCWLSDGVSNITLVARTTIAYVMKRWGVIPDTDRECLRVLV